MQWWDKWTYTSDKPLSLVSRERYSLLLLLLHLFGIQQFGAFGVLGSPSVGQFSRDEGF